MLKRRIKEVCEFLAVRQRGACEQTIRFFRGFNGLARARAPRWSCSFVFAWGEGGVAPQVPASLGASQPAERRVGHALIF